MTDRDPVGRREHRLDRRQARRVADGSRSPAHSARIWSIACETPLDRGLGLVRDAHLLEPQRQPGAEAHDDPAGRISSSAEPVIASTTG